MTLHELMASFPIIDIPRWTCTRSHSGLQIDTISSLQAGSIVGAVQSINANVALAGQGRGGNALGLQPVNQAWFEINVGWWNVGDDATAIGAIELLRAKIEALVRDVAIDLEYIFMNSANAKQPVIASYGRANVQRPRAV
ncbi:hypothetical protein GGR54DRAFT_136446 [Hypoxylon sp. NC1633]|nr:hypothetical protein GGR54DRAFT_136446 [Hypoxylon sp. NC1633]